MKTLITFFIMLCSITLYSQDTIVKRALRSPYLLDWNLITNDTISSLLGLEFQFHYGTIKSTTNYLHCNDVYYFNSTMVRLKECLFSSFT